MKITLEKEEQAYLNNMIRSSVTQLEGMVASYEKLKLLLPKTSGDRSYMDLSRDERLNLYNITKTGLKAVNDILSGIPEDAEMKRKDHLVKVQGLLSSIEGKLITKGEIDETPQI